MARLDPINVKYWRLAHSPNDLGVETHADFPCHCDICGDGKNPNSKRLHLFTKSTFNGDAVKCWNCGWTGNMWSYLSENHPALYTQYKRDKQSESFNEILTIHKLEEEKKEPTEAETEMPEKISLDFGESLNVSNFSNNEPRPQLEKAIDLPKLSNYHEAMTYIRNRGIEPNDDWLYSTGKVSFGGKEYSLQDYIIIPLLWHDGRWYGFQALAYKKKDFRVVLLPDNTGWKVWNWNNIDKTKPVYIFESIYDAISSGFDNVIAQLGASISQERLNELSEPIFCLDNQLIDEASIRESGNYLEKGYKVFLWPKGSSKFKDTNDLRKRNVPYDLIQKMITNNIYEGMQGVLKLKMEY